MDILLKYGRGYFQDVGNKRTQARARRRRRRRRHRLLGRLSPRPHGLEGRRAARARPAHLGHHLARRRPHRHVRLDLRDLDRDAQVHARSLRAARGGDRAVDRLQARSASSRSPPTAIASRSTAASRRSTATAASTCTRSRPAQVRGAVPARQDRRHPRRLLREGGRPRQPGRRDHGARPRARACRARRSSRACPSTGFLTKRGAVTGVKTPYGDIEARVRRQLRRHVGAPARRARSGVNIPLQSAEHYYLITEKIPGISARLAGARGSRARTATSARRCGGLMVGLFEPVCAPWKVGGVPEDFSFGEITPDWDRMGPYVEKAMRRVPDLARDRRAQVLLRARELHARSGADRRRGARAQELLRRRGPQLDRHPHRRRPRAACWRTGSSTAAPTSTSPA